MSKRWRLRWRILLPITCLALGSLLGFGLYEESMARQQGETLIRQRGESVLTRIDERIDERQRAKTVYAQLLTQLEGLPRLLDQNDVTGLLQILVPLRAKLGLGHVVVFDREGTCLLFIGDETEVIHSGTINNTSLVGLTKSHVDVTASGLVISAEAPIRSQNGIIGAILVGTVFDEKRLAEFTPSDTADLALYHGQDLQTVTGYAARENDLLSQAFQVSAGSGNFRIRLGDQSFEVVRHAINAQDSLLILVPTSDLVNAQRHRQITLLGVMVVMGTLLVITCFVLARDIARPLESMVAVTRGIVEGNFHRSVPSSTIDEIHQLGLAINQQSERIRSQIEALSHQAYVDDLTELPNRVSFMDHLTRGITRSATKGNRIGVIFLDIDNFKYVNDSLGHDAGDTLLSAVADRLRRCVRSSDVVARFGGDEFTVLIEGTRFPQDAVAVAERIIEALRLPVTLGTQDVYVTASLGIAVTADDSMSPEDLLRQADIAMFRAKAGGKAGYEIFEPSMTTGVSERMQLESDLRRALERQEILVHYQPIVDLGSRDLIQVEALVRWNHPTRGLISPATFIPIAEETGLILPIGRFVLQEACRQTKRWHDISQSGRYPSVNVNLSARQFQQPDLADEISRILAATDLDPRYVILELTESVMMQDAEATVRSLGELKRLGVRFAVDDFGTGYSSLAYLRRFPVDTLKIDRAFVSGIDSNSDDRAIIESIIALARALGLSVTGEGIETERQAACLRSLGCFCGQGFYFSRPVPALGIDNILRSSLLVQAA